MVSVVLVVLERPIVVSCTGRDGGLRVKQQALGNCSPTLHLRVVAFV